MSKYIKVADLSQEELDRQRERKRRNSKRFREENPDYTDAEQVRNYERHGKTWALDPATCEISVVDGEATDQGVYNLFQSYSPSLGIQSLGGKEARLGLFSCASFMSNISYKLRRKTGKKTRFVYYASGYDISQQLYGEKNMTPEEQAQAWHMRSRAWGAVRGPEFSPELYIASVNAGVQVGRKSGHVTFYPAEGSEHKPRRVAWQDMYTLFNCSLVKAVEEYARFWTPEEHARMDEMLDDVRAGKEARGKWEAAGYTPEQIAVMYQGPELYLMHWLANKVLSLCKEVGLYPRTLAGPAPIARALMHKYGVTHHIKPADYDSVEFQEGPIMRTIRKAFFGGNIQSSITGHLPNGYHVYDINSAHPSHIRDLPCGSHGYWRDLSQFDIEQSNQGNIIKHCIYHIRWRCAKGTQWGPFPVRCANGSTRYPLEGEGWYCSPEISAFIDCYDGAMFELLDGLQWVSTCKHAAPFRTMIQETYDRRVIYKKEKNPAGNILKLALNSCFGVQAQTHGSHRIIDENGETVGYETPKLSNLFLAALTTSGTRADIMRLVAANQNSVFAIATDAVKTFSPLDVEAVESDDTRTYRQLGGLEHEVVMDPAYVVMPGVIAHAGGHDKYRGVPSKSTWTAGYYQADSMYLAIDFALHDKLDTITAHFDEYQNPYAAGTAPGTEGQFIQSTRELNITPFALQTKRDTLLAEQIGRNLWYCPPYRRSPDGPSRIYMRPMDKGAFIFERPEVWGE